MSHQTSILEGYGYASPFGGSGVNAYFDFPQPPPTCAWLILRPASLTTITCGLPSVFLEQAGCIFSNLQVSFNIQLCCGEQECALAFPPGARRRRRRRALDAGPPQQLIAEEVFNPIESTITVAPQAEEEADVPIESTGTVPTETEEEADVPLESTGTVPTEADTSPAPTSPAFVPVYGSHERRWNWPWDHPKATLPAIPSIASAQIPSASSTPTPTEPLLACNGTMKQVSPPVETVGAQLRIGSDIDCGASNAACSQVSSINVHRGYNVVFQTVLGTAGTVSDIATSLAFSINFLTGVQLDYSTDTSLASSLTIPPGSKGVLVWVPYYTCVAVYATGCNNGVGNATLKACTPVVDAAKKAVGEFAIVTIG